MLRKRGRRSVTALGACVILALLVMGLSAGVADAHHRGKTILLQESAAMKLTSNSVNVHEAEGSATGTFRGSVHLRIEVNNAAKMTARFTTSGAKGGLIGIGIANYTVSGSVLRFSGTATISGGTGAYSNARGHGIRIEGALNRLKETMSLTFNGRMTI